MAKIDSIKGKSCKHTALLFIMSLALSCPLIAEAETDARSEKYKGGNLMRINCPRDCFIYLDCPRKLSLAQFNNEIALHPTDCSLYIHRGNYFLSDGDFENASKDFDKALSFNPKSALAHVGKSRTLRALGTMAEVYAELEKARTNSSGENSAKALWESAYLHRELKQYAVALKQYEQLLKLKLTDNALRAYAMFQTGETLIRMGKLKEGIAYFDVAKKLDPLICLFEPRAQAHYVLHDYKLSIDDYSSAIKLIVDSPKQSSAFDDVVKNLPHLYRQRALVYKTIGRTDLEAHDLNLAIRAQQRIFDDAPFRTK